VSGTSSLTVNGSYNSTLYGSGLTYTSQGIWGSSFSGNPVNMGSTSGFSYSDYLASLPTGSTLNDVTLNLSLLVGAVQGSVLGGPGTANLTGNLGPMTVTISAGGVTKTVTGTNLSSYDLFANGFSSALLAGLPLTLSFSASDTVTGSVTGMAPASGYSNDLFGIGRGGSFFFDTSSSSANLADTRTITGSQLANYLTLIYTGPTSSTPVVVPLVGPVDPIVDQESPEPMTFGLVGAGLGLVVYWRRKQRA
jgi:hypothetical protein